jgi:glycosyl transferase family 87
LELYFIVFKLSNEHLNKSDKRHEKQNDAKVSGKSIWPNLLHLGIVLLMCGLLFYAVSNQMFKPRTDVGKYQCYALVFWEGTQAVHLLPHEQCLFLKYYSPTSVIMGMKSLRVPGHIIHLAESQNTSGPFRNLPFEYPLLSIVPFSLGLIAPTAWYQVAFAIWMLLLAAIIYFILYKTRSTGAAIAFAFYLVIGNWGSAAARFDLVPAALILGSVILAARSQWNWAFALLALATMFKFFPVVLVVPFLIAQQKQYSDKWYSWHRWSALVLYCGICVMATLLSFSLNIANTINPFLYFFNRPIQVESTPATLLWIGKYLGYPIKIIQSYGSVNIASALNDKISPLSSLCLVAGLLYTFWLQWRDKLDIYTASLLTVLIIIITGKVFSPQYLIWLAPLVAFVGQANWKWLVTWGIIGLLTTWVYPNMYNTVPLKYVPLLQTFYPVVFARDLLILGFVIVLLYQAARKRFVVSK